ncbi:MAG TPA: TIM44-like domain-containing protein, partial [Kofleriaceae bacterium]|nr:TIM44-like domain-containing protein [Kofleriaceae bacterium]
MSLHLLDAFRPGGGETYHGGGGHSSPSFGGHSSSSFGGNSSSFGGSSGGDGGGGILELFYWLLRMIAEMPQIGIPVAAIFIGYFVYSAYRNHSNRDWDSGPPVEFARNVNLGALRLIDTEFSQVLFEDFAFRLFSTAHRARATAESLATVAPYVSEAARRELANREPIGEPVESVVIGAMRVIRVDIDGYLRIGLEFEANVTTTKHTFYSVETWLFGRDRDVPSKPPGATKSFPCPNCGAPWQGSATGTQVCASCGQVVDNGRFDWIVEDISVSSIDERPPTLTTEVTERGTDLPTYVHDGMQSTWAAFLADDPGVTEESLLARLTAIYDQLDRAWSQNQLASVRGLVSDGLYDYLQYWVDAYAREGLHNELVDMRITKTERAALIRDKHYDALTIRIWGRGKDYVVRDADGDVVRGSKHRERAYSEYWTLIRSASRRGPTKPDLSCANCGAPLAISMAGDCEHCGA